MQIDLGACSLDSLAFTVLVHSFLRRAWRSPTHTQEAKSLYIGQKSAKRNNSLPDTKVECNWGQTFWTNKKKRGTRGRESSKERKDERCFSIWSKCSTYLCKLKDIQKKDSFPPKMCTPKNLFKFVPFARFFDQFRLELFWQKTNMQDMCRQTGKNTCNTKKFHLLLDALLGSP